MYKSVKKVIVTLALLMLITTSTGYAQGYRGQNNYVNYNRFYRPTYTYNFNNSYGNWLTQSRPNYWGRVDAPSWNQVETPNQVEKPNKPEENREPNVKENNTGTSTASSIELEVVRLVNIERQKAGLAPLEHSNELSRVARAKSQDMANNNYFSHNSPSYGDPFAMMRSFGIQYKLAGENIAKGHLSAASVMNGWMNSTGHRDNILNPSFGTIGVGYVNMNGTTYWTQMFTD